MNNGILEYFGAHHKWYAQFDTGMPNRFGETVALGCGPSPDWATSEAMKVAEVDHGWHGACVFEAKNHG